MTLDALTPWPHRAFGGSSYFQTVPALNQYWHPWLLGRRVRGAAITGGERWELTGAQVYLAGRLRVRVARDGREVWAGESTLAGLEHGGLARAEAEAARRRA